MNKSTRDRIFRAIDEGKQAFEDGKTIGDCPYKVSIFGVGGFWESGWRQAENAKANAVQPSGGRT